ncbi:hypothetical protein LO772_25415 [Yinghuangia sp. ASG 101]|uniref:hypothetical protein n=1 Tax=Yinghuangia sp. ASG 101 TaxID=2896848 RepID=UPI001E2FD859|nr:hypothetical protein [Yinghuangia sp. ASG 101]UGQ10195.1 hypothetical protein LO772_25415 [Yinghuangia sp. ASG 101]
MTSRQVALLLGDAGHEVDVLAPEGKPPLRYPKSVRRVYTVPAFGDDPWGWLGAAEKTLRADGHDVLIPTGDQVAVLSRADAAATWLAGRVAVPGFAALERVQDKVSAAVTLTEIGLPQPESFVVRSAEALRQISDPPLYVKLPIGAASTGVHHITRREELLRLADRLDAEGTFATDSGVLVQQPEQGPVISAQSVFDNGRLVAAHAYLHTRIGSRGGAAAKRGVNLLAVREHITLLGAHIGWHGALSMDGVLTADGPVWIDVNPRLVEPANAARSGVDLVGALIGVSQGGSPSALPLGEPDVLTHQFLQALWAAGERGRGAVWRELWYATARRGPYRGSTEELLSPFREPRTLARVFALCAALVTAPAHTLGRATRNADRTALTASGWHRILAGPPPAP